GTYWVEALNDKGCLAQDTFLLETSYDLLQAQFMMPSEALVQDTVAMIEISWPLPDTIVWTFPQEMLIVEDYYDVVFGQYSAPGVYNVGVAAVLAGCDDQISKSITISDRPAGPGGGRLGHVEYVKEFALLPNPNNGSFDVEVELLEVSPIVMSVWNAGSATMVGKVQDSGSDSYYRHIDFRPLSPGVYILRLDHKNGKEYLRFIVH
ncbi:MAG: T9SS type A sorting domain-containing protein, partial [Cyclobacteriaceae bacterium]|nr:T9SS type A sorting domain-containing protein [Cyclobacteriaceae bacterium]